MKHTPLIRLQAAVRRYTSATESCPHWDYESDGYGHPCCDEVQDARHELRKARKVAAIAHSRHMLESA